MARTKRAERPEPTATKPTRTREQILADAAPAFAALIRENREREAAKRAESDRRAS